MTVPSPRVRLSLAIVTDKNLNVAVDPEDLSYALQGHGYWGSPTGEELFYETMSEDTKLYFDQESGRPYSVTTTVTESDTMVFPLRDGSDVLTAAALMDRWTVGYGDAVRLSEDTTVRILRCYAVEETTTWREYQL